MKDQSNISQGTIWGPSNDERSAIAGDGICFYQRLRAPHTPSGNPRRLYVVYELQQMETKYPAARIVKVFDDGYAGMPDELRHVAGLMPVDVTATVYNQMLKNEYNDYEVILQ